MTLLKKKNIKSVKLIVVEYSFVLTLFNRIILPDVGHEVIIRINGWDGVQF